MSEEHVFSSNWPKRHHQSMEKWGDKMKEKLDDRIIFDYTQGWNDLVVMETCGYCGEFSSFSFYNTCPLFCNTCPLFVEKYCSTTRNIEVIFWKFVIEMRKEKPDFQKAEELRQKMFARIQQDTPKNF